MRATRRYRLSPRGSNTAASPSSISTRVAASRFAMWPTTTTFSPSRGLVPSSRRSARTRPVYVPTRSAGIPVSAERELGGLARAAVAAREHVAHRDLELAPRAPDRTRLRATRVRQVALPRTVRQRHAQAVALRPIRRGVAQEDDVSAPTQPVDDLERAVLRLARTAAPRDRDDDRCGEQAHAASIRTAGPGTAAA
jgi:hypothetical protein